MKKTLGIYDSHTGGNDGHLEHIKGKATQWVNRMTNGHLPSHIVWVAYRQQLWPGLFYGLGTMTNDIKAASTLLDNMAYKTLNVLGILWNVTKGLRRLHTTFGGVGMFNLPTEQLISRVNMFFQHYHVSTNLSKKLDTSLRYLQLQIGTPHNPFTLNYTKWGTLAPLSWVQMLWKSLHYFDITLYMSYPTIPPPRECNQVIMEIIFSHDLDTTTIKGLNRCRGLLEALFLSDITMADGKYLEHFMFDPVGGAKSLRYTFPREQATRQDWDSWINFWHTFTNTGGKLKTPLGGWTNPTHQIWMWYYREEGNKLYRINRDKIALFKQATGWRRIRATMPYQFIRNKISSQHTEGTPTSVIELPTNSVNNLQEGPSLVLPQMNSISFSDYIAKWG